MLDGVCRKILTKAPGRDHWTLNKAFIGTSVIWNVKSPAPSKETLPCQIEDAWEEEGDESSQSTTSGSQLSGEIYHVDGPAIVRRVEMPGDDW